jgi:hypothetical protein
MIGENIIIPKYFIYPIKNEIIARAEYFWSFEKNVSEEIKEDTKVYASLKIILNKKNNEVKEYIFVRKNLKKIKIMKIQYLIQSRRCIEILMIKLRK